MEKQSIYLRKVLQSDIKLIFEWANDKDARNNSFKTKEITWAEHETWFENTLKDLKTRHYILCYNGNDIGQIRIKIEEENQGKISYSIDKAYRGLGFGKIILQLCENALLEEFKDFYLYADVKKSNIAFISIGTNDIKNLIKVDESLKTVSFDEDIVNRKIEILLFNVNEIVNQLKILILQVK